MQTDALSLTFAALADPTRRAILQRLSRGEASVSELTEPFDISMPAISRHLKVLKDAGLVQEVKAGRENVYSLQRGRLKPMLDWLEKHRAAKLPQKQAAKPIVVKAAPVASPKPKPQKAPRPVAAPPPAAAPQLSFFDL